MTRNSTAAFTVLLAWAPFCPPACLCTTQAGAPASSVQECKSLTVQLLDPAASRLKQLEAILATRVQEHSGLTPVIGTNTDCTVELDIQNHLDPEAFRIEEISPRTLRISGGDERGVLYGIGKFLRMNSYRDGSFTLGAWRGDSKPEKPFRAIYFATHFFNYYHEAPIDEVRRYVEDLGLWGYNALIVWFDMHHYQGIQDPAAQAMLHRLNDLLDAAKNVGLDTGITLNANEAYANSPEALRADWTAGHDAYFEQLNGHYHVELCPYLAGAKDLLLKWREEVFDAFKDVGLNYVIIWPYDQGGCTCSMCTPWGANGFWTIAEPIAQLAHRDFPHCKVILSTWKFDEFIHGEWAAFERKFAQEHPNWIDYLMADDAGVKRFATGPPEHHIPGSLPLLSFPEISMWGAIPWGGFGANPLPHHHQQLWDIGKRVLGGGMPYSEGIFEDLNKALYAQFFWNQSTPAGSIVDEYIAYEFSPDAVSPIRKVIHILEPNYPRTVKNLSGPKAPVRFVLAHRSGAGEAFDLIERVDASVSPRIQHSWRWRIFYLRSFIDAQLVRNKFAISEQAASALDELTKIYYAAGAEFVVAPPTQKAIERFRREGGGASGPPGPPPNHMSR